MNKPRLATAWLDGCSGCHMSILDLDERLIELARFADIVYSPLVDAKEYPEDVDIVLVEGAVSSDEDLKKIHTIRRRTKTLVSLGDCAVTSNVPGMRNRFPIDSVTHRAYFENAQFNQQVPRQVIPPLLPTSRPVHEFVKVDLFVPGCPPSADTIHFVLTELLSGKAPDLTNKTRFGA
ncbi:MAG: NADP oxidoreductase [Verrucomicrobia bacterium]|nr:NADP oxidoreductase [Verrucomicrobiota bacterium]MBV8375484.1 NADP oxidoreductase [Verrucomicrobiota bacterium]